MTNENCNPKHYYALNDNFHTLVMVVVKEIIHTISMNERIDMIWNFI